MRALGVVLGLEHIFVGVSIFNHHGTGRLEGLFFFHGTGVIANSVAAGCKGRHVVGTINGHHHVGFGTIYALYGEDFSQLVAFTQ